MGIQNLLWQVTKKAFTGGIIGVTISDRCCSVVPVRGDSMSPTLNPQRNSYLGKCLLEENAPKLILFDPYFLLIRLLILDADDYVLVEKFCLQDYKFVRGDVVVFSSPTHFKDKYIKRIVGLPGEWISSSRDVIRVPEGHCWVEGDNKASSLDSRTFGPIPLGLIRGRVTSVVWPPQRFLAFRPRFSSGVDLLKMGRLFVIDLQGETYSCKHCHTPFALTDDLISKSFHCKHGRAYLFENVVNVTVGEMEHRIMMTGWHTVADIFCVCCGSLVGWKYEIAYEKSQKYKEGKFIIESRFKVLGPDGGGYDMNEDEPMIGSDEE
ncbi:unnamed protein product [Brassica rapa]|uniref:Mitochondrial inner membrane protease subunit 2 n=4 Tax=Brassica TaxID=3705 RepID=A0A816TYH5_BRANA|nr:unnamed protein product [Brassica napus]CAG7878065.1 unnamed protein product [Brassica rapa]